MAKLASASSAVRAILEPSIVQAFSAETQNGSLRTAAEAERSTLGTILERLRKGAEVLRTLNVSMDHVSP